MKLKTLLEQILDDMRSMEEVELDLDSLKFVEDADNKSIQFTVGDAKYVCNFTRSHTKASVDSKTVVEVKFYLLNSLINLEKYSGSKSLNISFFIIFNASKVEYSFL